MNYTENKLAPRSGDLYQELTLEMRSVQGEFPHYIPEYFPITFEAEALKNVVASLKGKIIEEMYLYIDNYGQEVMDRHASRAWWSGFPSKGMMLEGKDIEWLETNIITSPKKGKPDTSLIALELVLAISRIYGASGDQVLTWARENNGDFSSIVKEMGLTRRGLENIRKYSNDWSEERLMSVTFATYFLAASLHRRIEDLEKHFGLAEVTSGQGTTASHKERKEYWNPSTWRELLISFIPEPNYDFLQKYSEPEFPTPENAIDRFRSEIMFMVQPRERVQDALAPEDRTVPPSTFFRNVLNGYYDPDRVAIRVTGIGAKPEDFETLEEICAREKYAFAIKSVIFQMEEKFGIESSKLGGIFLDSKGSATIRRMVQLWEMEHQRMRGASGDGGVESRLDSSILRLWIMLELEKESSRLENIVYGKEKICGKN